MIHFHSPQEIARKQRGEASSSNPSPRDTPSDRRARSLSAQRRHMRTPTSGFSESEEDSQRSHSSSGIPVPPMRSRSSNGRHSFHGSYKTPLQGKDMGPWSEDNTSLKSNGESKLLCCPGCGAVPHPAGGQTGLTYNQCPCEWSKVWARWVGKFVLLNGVGLCAYVIVLTIYNLPNGREIELTLSVKYFAFVSFQPKYR